MTQTGINWLKEVLATQEKYFTNLYMGWVEYFHGSTDHSADFCSPIFYPVAAFVGVGKFFSAAMTVLVCWPVAIYKDLRHLQNDLAAALTSLFFVTPLFVTFATIYNLIASLLYIVFLVFCFVILILFGICFGAQYVAKKILNAIGDFFAYMFRTATRK